MTERTVIAQMMPALGRVYFGDLRCRVDREPGDTQKCRIVFFNEDDIEKFKAKMTDLLLPWRYVSDEVV